MFDSDYYPAGAYNDPRAPYNEKYYPERDFNVTMTYTLERCDTITTDEYICEGGDTEEGEYYEEYYIEHSEQRRVLENSAVYTLESLLDEMMAMCDEKINDDSLSSSRVSHYRHLKSEAEAWRNAVEDHEFEFE